jgi:hypothetical protein
MIGGQGTMELPVIPVRLYVDMFRTSDNFTITFMLSNNY